MYSGLGGGSVVWLLTCSWISHIFYFHTFVHSYTHFYLVFVFVFVHTHGLLWLYTQELLLGGLRRNARKGTWVDCIQGPSAALSFLSPSVHSKGADSDLKACYLSTNIALITMKHIFPDN